MALKLLLIGDEKRILEAKSVLLPNNNIEVEISDGDEEEDFDEYDIILDLNLDDNSENMAIYAGLKNKVIICCAVKQSLAEMVFAADMKVKSLLFGLNALPTFLGKKTWEMSAFRAHDIEPFKPIAEKLGIQPIFVADRTGMVIPRIRMVAYNEAVSAIFEHATNAELLETLAATKPLHQIDEIGITDVFETLLAIYEDTKDERYKPCPLLKTKYLKNHTFFK